MYPRDHIDEALRIARMYGKVDGAHHKQWVIDQMVRALTGCPQVRIDRGPEAMPHFRKGESFEYLKWVADFQAGEDGPETYTWDTGIAP